MRAYVLRDPRLAELAGRFVWLDIDTENPRNAAFVEQFPLDAWPTLLVVDPATESVVVRWAGTATAPQIVRLAADGERALRAGQRSRADAALARADRLLGERRHADAAAELRAALAAGGRAWPGRERASETLVQALGLSGEPAACAAAAREVLPGLVPGAAFARIAAQGLSCAVEQEEGATRAAALAALEPAARRALAAPGVLADDRSWLYDALSSARAAAGDAAGARAVAERWLGFLEREARKARTPAERAALDGQRISAALRLGAPARALPAVTASARALPDDFVPQSNLALLYLKLDRPGEARAAADRALARAAGPRRVRVLLLRADAEEALGDRAAARASLAEAVRTADALPEALRPRGPAEAARRKLQALDAG